MEQENKTQEPAPSKKQRNPTFRSTRKGIKYGAIAGGTLGALSALVNQDPAIPSNVFHNAIAGAALGGAVGGLHDIYRYEGKDLDLISLIQETDDADFVLDTLMEAEEDGQWIQNADVSKGKLHKALGVPEGEVISPGKLEQAYAKAKKLKDVHMMRMINFAKNVRGLAQKK